MFHFYYLPSLTYRTFTLTLTLNLKLPFPHIHACVQTIEIFLMRFLRVTHNNIQSAEIQRTQT